MDLKALGAAFAAKRAADGISTVGHESGVSLCARSEQGGEYAQQEAQMELIASKWAEANDDVTAAQKALDEFAGTSVASSKEWTALAAKVADLRQRIEPHLARIAEMRAALASS